MTTQLEPFSGQELFAAPPSSVFAALTTPESLAAAIPDKVSHEIVDARTFKCVVAPGFSFIRANMRMTVSIVEATPDAQVLLHIASSAIGTSMQVECLMQIEPAGENAARLRWRATVTQLAGLIAAVPPSVIRGAADKVIHEGWTSLRRQVEE
jgi:carbon monoxide dehydrogenase subunit G